MATDATIDRGPRGVLHVSVCQTRGGVSFVELQHVDDAGNKGRGSTLQISELPALIAALRAIHVREHSRKPASPVQQQLPGGGPDEAARRDMAAF